MSLFRLSIPAIAAFVIVSGHTALAQAESPPAASEPPTDPAARCVHFHMDAQRQRHAKKLVEAKASMRECAMAECPAMVQQDCLQWIQSIDEQTPSVVFSIEADGKPITSAKVSIDGHEVDASAGTAVPMNPGPHDYVVINPPFEPQSGAINVLEGQRYRVFNIRFVTPKAAAPVRGPVTKTETFRPVPMSTWVLLGVGVAGAGAFAAMGLTGQAQESDLKKVCSPNCTDHDLKSMKSLYLGADIAAAVGAAAVVAAGVVFLSRPSYERQVAVGIAPVPGGFQTAVTWSHF
jgi:hypothetical protein